MNPHRIFKKEFDELVSFYQTASFSIQQIFELYKYQKKPRELEIDQNFALLTRPPFFKNNRQFVLNQQFFLRELTLIRLISALEVYLIENIKYIAANNIYLFKTNEIINFTASELISYESITEIFENIVTKDCRKLASGGYKKITGYYKSKFKINISCIFPGQSIMDEYHDRRHLFVHRLGKTDEYYRNKYNLEKVGLSIDEPYILKAINDIKLYAESIDKITKTIIENKPNPKSSKREKLVVFKFHYVVELPEFLDKEFRFWHNDKLVSAQDILASVTNIENNFIEVVLFGPSTKVSAFYKNAKNHLNINKGFSSIQTIQNIDYGIPMSSSGKISEKKIIYIDESVIEQVKNLLPEQPWNKGIHKQVAEELMISKKSVKRAITILIKRGIFKHQIDGNIIE